MKNFLHAYFNIYFFGLWGIQILILLLYISGLKDSSQAFTIPFRVLFSIFCLIIFLKKNIYIVLFRNRVIHLIFFFYILMIIRFIADDFFLFTEMGTKGITYFFRFVSMIVFPSLVFLTPLNRQISLEAKKGITYSCFIFLIFGFYLYRNSMGMGYRESQYDSEMGMDEFINPMIFSYVAFTLFGIAIWEFFYNKKSNKYIFFLIGVSLFAIVWSGTRNVLLGVIFIMLYITLENVKSIKSFFKILFFWIAGGGTLLYLLIKKGSEILARFETLFNEISNGDSNAGSNRMEIWTNGFDQFLNSPIFGSGIEEEVTKYIAHNMYLEAFMATGVFGGFIFLIIVFITFKRGYKLLVYNSPYGWLMILFLERCFTGLFSTSVLDPLFWLIVVAINANTVKKNIIRNDLVSMNQKNQII